MHASSFRWSCACTVRVCVCVQFLGASFLHRSGTREDDARATSQNTRKTRAQSTRRCTRLKGTETPTTAGSVSSFFLSAREKRAHSDSGLCIVCSHPSFFSCCLPADVPGLAAVPDKKFAQPYLAPELVRDVPYDAAVDLWAVGIVTYELLHGYTPFRCVGRRQVLMSPSSRSFLCFRCRLARTRDTFCVATPLVFLLRETSCSVPSFIYRVF